MPNPNDRRNIKNQTAEEVITTVEAVYTTGLKEQLFRDDNVNDLHIKFPLARNPSQVKTYQSVVSVTFVNVRIQSIILTKNGLFKINFLIN